MTRSRSTVLALAAGSIAVVVLIFLAKLGDEPDDTDMVELRAEMWNIDDEATIYVDCKPILRGSGAARRSARVEVRPDAIVTAQVDNDLNVYSWGIRVTAGGNEIVRSQQGRAEYLGANRNDAARAFETVFDKSVRVDGTPAKAPMCVRT